MTGGDGDCGKSLTKKVGNHWFSAQMWANHVCIFHNTAGEPLCLILKISDLIEAISKCCLYICLFLSLFFCLCGQINFNRETSKIFIFYDFIPSCLTRFNEYQQKLKSAKWTLSLSTSNNIIHTEMASLQCPACVIWTLIQTNGGLQNFHIH